MLLGCTGLVIVIVTQQSPAQPRPRTAGGDVDITVLGWACCRYRHGYTAQPSPDQERPEAMLTLLGWAGLAIVIVTQLSPAQPSSRTAGGDVDFTGLGWAGLVIVIVIATQLSPALTSVV